MLHLSSYHSNGLPTVVWSNKVNLIGEKVYKPKIHFCEHCNKPILIYGRLIPCKHVFCFSCATLCLTQQQQANLTATIQQDLSLDSPASNNSNVLGPPGTPTLQPPTNGSAKGCHRCNARALRVERNMLNSIFVCQIESCRRTYLSARDLQAHVNHRHSKNKSNNNHSGTASASLAAISSSPYISSSSLLHLNSHNNNSNNNSNNNNSSSGNNNHSTSNNNQSRQSASSSSINHSGNNNSNSPNYHHQQHHSRHDRDSHQRNRDRDRYRDREVYQRDRERERDSKEYHRQSIQRAAQWAEASAQMMEKGFTR